MKPRFCANPNCKEQFQPYKTTDKACSYLCQLAINEQKEIDARFKKIKAKVKERDSIKDLTKIALQLAQKWARIRDEHRPCISCGKTKCIQWQGGHLYKSKLYSGVKFADYNIHKQCHACNHFMDGNEVNYIHGLIDRYGMEYVNYVRKVATETKDKKWSVPELRDMIAYYKNRIKNGK